MREKDTLGGRALFLVPALLGLALYAVHLRSDLYGDEDPTFQLISGEHFASGLLSPTLCHPPLYFVAGKLCYALVGAPWAIRLPSVLVTVGTVLLIGRIGRRIGGKAVGLWAVWVAGLSPMLLEFAAEGRPYAMLAFFSAALVDRLLAFLDRESGRSMLLLGLVAVAGLLTHFIFALHLVFAAGYYLARRRKLTKYACGVLAIAAPAIVLQGVGVVLNVGHSTGYTEFWRKEYLSLANFAARLPVAMSFGYCTFDLPRMDPARNVTTSMIRENWPLLAVAAAALVAVACALVLLALRKQRHLGLLLCGALVPVVLGMAAGKAGLFLVREKYLIGILGCYVVLLALAFRLLSRSWAGRGAVAAYGLVVLVSIVHYVFYPNEYSRRMDWSGLKAAVAAHVKRGDTVVFYRIQRTETRDVPIPAQDVRAVDLAAEKPAGMSVKDFANQIERSSKGAILVVSNEVQRVSLDPGGQLLRALGRARSGTEQRFGRNLSLYVFRPGSRK